MTNNIIILGLALFCISGVFMALSGFYVLSTSIMNLDILLPNDVYSGCSNCSAVTDLILYEVKVFAIVGGIMGSFGAWFVVVGYRETKGKPNNEIPII